VIRDVTGYQPLVPPLAAVVGGIGVDRIWPQPAGAWFLLAAGAIGVWWIVWRQGRERLGATLLMLACGATGGSWHHCCWSLFPRDNLGHFARQSAQPVCLEVVALKSARVVPPAPPDPLRSLPTTTYTRVEIEARAIRDGSTWRHASGSVELCIAGRREDIRAGDRMRVFAALTAPRSAENPGQFDFARYLRADRRRAMLYASHAEGVQVLERGCAAWLARSIDAARLRNQQYLDRYLNAERVGLASAVLVGAREQLDPEQSAAFMETGTTHLLVVSGLNVGILAGTLWWLLRRTPMPRTLSMGIVGLTTGAYMLLTDAEPPIVRATVLVLGGGLALLSGRRGMPFNTLAAAALIVLAINPVDLFNVGAQLSFLCVAGMAWLVPPWFGPPDMHSPLERLIERSRSGTERLRRACGRLFLVSLLLALLTGPLVAARFHLVAPVAPLMNVVLWLPVFTGTLGGFGLLLLGWLWPLGYVFGQCCNGSMWALQNSVDLVRRLPGSHFWVAGPADWWLAGLYAALAIAAAWPRLLSAKRLCGLLGAWLLIGCGVSGFWPREQALECTFLAVGHGCATVLRLPDGRTLLCDAGHLGPPRVASRAVAGFLWAEGLTRIDTLMISHADTDHFNAVPELLDRFRVDEVCVGPVMFRNRSPAVAVLREALRRHQLVPRIVRAGDTLNQGACTVRALHPPGEGVVGSDNANSLVLVVEYRGQRILLPGDLDAHGLDSLLSQPPERCAVVLSPHHGSKRSRPDALAAWAGARWLVVSGGNRPGGDRESASKPPAGGSVLSTDQCGAVRVRIDAQGLAVKGYRETRPLNVQTRNLGPAVELR
jgi:competence protein ComEC